jgi:hypothetical protein
MASEDDAKRDNLFGKKVGEMSIKDEKLLCGLQFFFYQADKELIIQFIASFLKIIPLRNLFIMFMKVEPATIKFFG